jgi:hypothetical protein
MFALLASSISFHPLFLEGPSSQITQILTAGMFPEFRLLRYPTLNSLSSLSTEALR